MTVQGGRGPDDSNPICGAMRVLCGDAVCLNDYGSTDIWHFQRAPVRSRQRVSGIDGQYTDKNARQSGKGSRKAMGPGKKDT